MHTYGQSRAKELENVNKIQVTPIWVSRFYLGDIDAFADFKISLQRLFKIFFSLLKKCICPPYTKLRQIFYLLYGSTIL